MRVVALKIARRIIEMKQVSSRIWKEGVYTIVIFVLVGIHRLKIDSSMYLDRPT